MRFILTTVASISLVIPIFFNWIGFNSRKNPNQ
jgi:hypothetical protein